MNELTLKCTRYAIVENDRAKLYVKDVDDNLKTSVIQSRGPNYDSITIIDKDAQQTKFFNCQWVDSEQDVKDGDFLTHPILITYVSKEPI